MDNTKFPDYKEWGDGEQYYLQDYRNAGDLCDTHTAKKLLEHFEEACELLSYFGMYDKPREFLRRIRYEAKAEQRDPENPK